MAMNGDKLGLAWAKVVKEASKSPPTPAMVSDMEAFWKKMASELVNYLNEDNPISFKCGSSELSVSSSGITIKGTMVNLN